MADLRDIPEVEKRLAEARVDVEREMEERFRVRAEEILEETRVAGSIVDSIRDKSLADLIMSSWKTIVAEKREVRFFTDALIQVTIGNDVVLQGRVTNLHALQPHQTQTKHLRTMLIIWEEDESPEETS